MRAEARSIGSGLAMVVLAAPLACVETLNSVPPPPVTALATDPFFFLGPWEVESRASVTLPLPPGAEPVSLDVVSALVRRWAGSDAPNEPILRVGISYPDLIASASAIVDVGVNLDRGLYRGQPERFVDLQVPNPEDCTNDPDPYCAPKTIQLSYNDVEAANEGCPSCVPDILLVGPSGAGLHDIPWLIADERRICYGRAANPATDSNLAEIMGLPAEANDDPLSSEVWAPFREECAVRAEFDAVLNELEAEHS